MAAAWQPINMLYHRRRGVVKEGVENENGNIARQHSGKAMARGVASSCAHTAQRLSS